MLIELYYWIKKLEKENIFIDSLGIEYLSR